MANPKVEKLKDFGLRYGDKFAVALASMVFLLCLIMAFKRPTVEIQPEQIKKYAEAAETNITRRVDDEEILKTLVEQGLKDSNFAKQAEASANIKLVAADFRAAREWVTPEPGAGLIRETPDLLAPVHVYAYPGRGGALVYALDSEGNRIPETEKKEPPKPTPQRHRRRRGGGGGGSSGGGGSGGGMMSGMMGGGGRPSGKSQAELEKEAKEKNEKARREMIARLSGNTKIFTKDELAKETETTQGPPPKEITKGLRWVALTATLDHAQMLANYRKALKNPSIAQPYYLRLELQRQTLQPDGSWTEWEDVDSKRNLEVLDNLPEVDEEWTLDNVRPDNLNDPLPFLRAGLWEKVHVGALVPKEKRVVAEVKVPSANDSMMMMGSAGAMMGSAGMADSAMMGAMMSSGGMMGSGSGMSGMDPSMMGGAMDSGAMMMMGGGSGSGMMGMGMMGGAAPGVEAITDFWKSEEKTIQVRKLDFTAEPDGGYQYRMRIVVMNPNYKRDDVSPKTALTKEQQELFGPWSEPSNEVHMPSDVSAYAMGVLPAGPKSDMKVTFQVVKFAPADGVTVPSMFEGSPGEIVGDPVRRDVPVSDGTGKKAKLIDFNSHQIVLDVDGGWQPMPQGFPGGGLPRPAMALMLRPDGAVIVRDQADDQNDPVRKDIESNYKAEIEASTKERTNSMGSGMDAMMGSAGGMMDMGGYR